MNNDTKNTTKMTLGELIYTPHDKVKSSDHPHTMVLMVDSEMLPKYKKDPSIPLADVVDSFEILKYDNAGKSGTKGKPSKQELEDVFGTTRDDDIVKFMLEHGKLHGTPM